MNEKELAQQTMVENRLLGTIMEGIRETLVWKPSGKDFSRKLTTLRFISQSLQRHLEHLMSLEEYDGYMDSVKKGCPQLARTVEELRQDHEGIRSGMSRLSSRLERMTTSESGAFVDLCADMDDFLTKLERHRETEMKVMREAFAGAG